MKLPLILLLAFFSGALVMGQEYVQHPIGAVPATISSFGVDLDGTGLPDLLQGGNVDLRLLSDPGPVLAGLSAPNPPWIVLATQASFPMTTGSLASSVQDMDGDGLPDLVVTRTGPGSGTSAWILTNLGAGSFAAPQLVVSGLMGTVLRFGDLDGNGLTDIINEYIVFGQGESYDVYLYQANGTFSAPQSAMGNVRVLADFNADGLTDFVLGPDGPMAINSVRLGTPTGPAAPVTLNLPQGSTFGQFLTTEDINGDDIDDLVYWDGALGNSIFFAAFGDLTNPL